MRKGTALWVLLALLGLVLAAGVTAAASRLSTQQIGLSSEPLSAGRALAPSTKQAGSTGSRGAAKKPAHRTPARRGVNRRPAPQPSQTAPSQTAPSQTAPSGTGSGPGPSSDGSDDHGSGGDD